MTEGSSEFLKKYRGQTTTWTTQLLQYGVAIVSVALAVASNFFFSPYLAPTLTPPFFAAVMISAWYGGLGPGLLATLLSTLAINYFLVEPIYSLNIPSIGTLARLSVFVMAALLINSLNAAQRSATWRAEANLEALRQSEARFGRLVESTIIGIIVADLNGSILEANDIFLETVGYTKEELRAGRLNWRTLTPPEFFEVSEQAVQQLNTTGACTPFEKEYIRKDGSRVSVLHGAVMTGEATVLGFVLDITNRKQAEAALRQSESRFQILVSNMPGMVYCYAPSRDGLGTFTYVSSGSRELVELEPATILEDANAFLGLLHPDDWPSFQESVAIAVKNSAVWQWEGRLITPSGKLKWVQGRSRPQQTRYERAWDGLLLDITDRKQAEEALRQSEERLRVALKNSPITIFNQDRNLRYTWLYNPTVDHPIMDVVGKKDDDLWTRDDAAILTQIKNSVLETGIGVREEVRLTMHGQDFYYDLTVEPLYGMDQAIIGVTCSAIDVTERKQIELALRQSETTLSAFIASSPIGIAFFDQSLRYVHINDALAAINGVPKSEHLRRSLWDVLPHWASIVVPILQQVMDTKEPLLNQEVVGATNPSDLVRHCLVNYFPVCLPDGQLLGVGVTSLDITDRRRMEEELRQSEERYRYLAELIPQLVWTTDAEGLLLDVNQRWLDFTGLTLEQAQNQGWQTVIHPHDVPVLKQHWAIAQHNSTHYQAEGRMRRADGTYRWHLHQAIPFKTDQGKILKWFGTATDIEEQKQLHQERDRLLQQEQTARAEAEMANRIKDEFLAVLSHELRSPLNPILGWSKLLLTGNLDARTSQQALETIERNARLQTQLIEDLLDVSRILRGKMVLNIYPVSLVTVIESALETVRLAAEAKGIDLRLVVGNVSWQDSQAAESNRHSSSLQVFGDSARLQQIVWNLLSNAVKFTPSKGQVEVRLDQVDTYAQIQVQDTGKGISPDFLPYVFDYFRQEDSKTTRKFGGLGLGLAIVRHLTELHGGTVHVESPGENQGATFTVKLPLTTIAVQPAQAVANQPQSIDLSQLQILVVDDDEDMRDLIRVILEQQGAQVTVATCASEVLMYFDRQPPDLLISDIGMSEMDGYMLMRHIRSRSPEQGGQVPAIALTAYAGEINQKQALEVGFQKHLSKPVAPNELIKALTELIQSV